MYSCTLPSCANIECQHVHSNTKDMAWCWGSLWAANPLDFSEPLLIYWELEGNPFLKHTYIQVHDVSVCTYQMLLAYFGNHTMTFLCQQQHCRRKIEAFQVIDTVSLKEASFCSFVYFSCFFCCSTCSNGKCAYLCTVELIECLPRGQDVVVSVYVWV